MRAQFISAKEIQQIMDVSRTKAYQIVRDLNNQLEEMGYITVPGKCPVQYFKQKCYGVEIGGEEN